MIIRVLGEGQYEVPEAALAPLNALDARLQAAVDGGDAPAFATVLTELLDVVRRSGAAMPDHLLTASDLVLPAADSDLAGVAALLADDGLIPG